MVFEHEHPLNLIDLWSEQLQYEEEYEEDEEENEDELVAKQEFKCMCSRCDEEINWYHRYYYTCGQCKYSIHKFCAELPEKMEDICHPHTLYLLQKERYWWCDVCYSDHNPHDLLCYGCLECYFIVDVKCAMKKLQKHIIHHPSHKHPLVCMAKQIICECDACGKEHKGVFYHCLMCSGFIHNHCVFLPKKLQIQHTTNDFFTHIHPLNLAYTFPKADQRSKFYPRCRVCRQEFNNENLWIYKCEKCRYYTHLDCATSRNEPFMSILTSPGTGKILKNYEDAEHPNLLHLPFRDPSYSLLKHLFFKENGSNTCKTHDIGHQHPLTLVDARCGDITIPTSSTIKSISYHDPMKRIQLLCDGCVRPITSGPIYVCDNEGQCNFVFHEWCSRLPAELKDHPAHRQHTLILHSKAPPRKFFGVFLCDACRLHCNGFAYCCMDCNNFIIDVHCAFLPKEITHTFHPNHLLSRVYHEERVGRCRMCGDYFFHRISFDCHTCNDFRLHVGCALFIPETTRNKCDKHPMKLSYFPIENHKSDYFCEVCERELNPEMPFYHCHECMQSMHTACAPSILQYETYDEDGRGVYQFVNMKFGGTYNNIEVHPHPLSFLQGIQDDGQCARSRSYGCYEGLQYNMIFKCLDCKFAVHYKCCERMSN
ncbi:putative chromatin regulator PHD family [Helianthus annuus]|nr:putative chromatin regulator PHD family [Helianthus annuus]